MPLKIITFKIDEDTLVKLDVIANQVGTSRSEIIRKAIILYANKLEQEIKQKPRIRVIRD